tara:strand:- start:17069 stop:17893 length:825 start_codon:yes stop_codon:yes gene_type:complete
LKAAVLIIGCGEIGASLISGWLNKKKIFKKKISKIFVIEKNLLRRKNLKKKFKKEIFFIDEKKDINLINKINYIFLSVKPKDLNSLFNYNLTFNKNSIIFSVLAGKHVKDIKKIFSSTKNIIRLMLNTPISINEGTIVYFSEKLLKNEKDLFLLNLIGRKFKLKNEKFFDLMTAIVGSGPAYFYYILEAMQSVTLKNNVDKKLAIEILKNTFYGTAKILMNENKSFSELRKKVASRGGTTESGIKFLEKKHTKKILINSINQAIKKARILRSLK